MILMLTGSLARTPGLVALAATVALSLVIAAVWARDIHMVSETLRLAERGDPQALAQAAAAPVLPHVERITRGIERLAKTLASRGVQVGELVRASDAIVERLPDPLLVLGPDRTVRRANAAARAAFGAELPAVLRHPGLRGAIDRVFDGRGSETAELLLPVPVERDVTATVMFLDPPLADGGQAIVLLADRTRERAVERMRADFVANVSHELRTPLASLMGFVETLRGPAADDVPAQQRFLAIMAAQAERMKRLIDDLLSLSRIELAEHQAPSETVMLGELVASVAAGFQPRRSGLTVEVAPDVPEVVGDWDQLVQVVTNLVENGLKYGGGKVRVTIARAAPGGKLPARPGVVLAVADQGPGIAREHLARLTERFYRVDKARSRSAGGTGLGLAIVKHIVNRHRGVLLIESDEGKGSTFTVWLPV